MQRRQEYVARCRDEVEERRRKVNILILPSRGHRLLCLHKMDSEGFRLVCT